MHLRDEGTLPSTRRSSCRPNWLRGLDFLVGDAEAMRCFGFMNEVMAQQRIHSQIAEQRSRDSGLDLTTARAQVPAPGRGPTRGAPSRSPSSSCRSRHHPARAGTALRRRGPGRAALLPTGGGKTEAYLGLAAYAFAIRRRQGLLATPDGPLDGRAGVTVLMRYTLRLLTSQQFQRATTLVCAAELARQAAPAVWGDEPFRIGLWVGTDVSPKRIDEAAEQPSGSTPDRATGSPSCKSNIARGAALPSPAARCGSTKVAVG